MDNRANVMLKSSLRIVVLLLMASPINSQEELSSTQQDCLIITTDGALLDLTENFSLFDCLDDKDKFVSLH